uniref:DNA-binding protein RHL1 n=1 Tax=Oryza meridionalis TaxID=40149 RepID=A0A0E0E804_9ORYZ
MVKKKAAGDAEADERCRLRSLAFSNGLLQRGEPAAPRSALTPSTSVSRLQGRDIVRRGGQRKSRFLFSFPGLLAPAAAASGGRVGELADLGTKNPLLYLDFPQGRMKLLGTHVYPKNKYLTLQMSRSTKGVVCEDVFESLIVFSEAWWIGTKEENPQELKLDFPKEFQNDGAVADSDFKGGAGASCDEAVTINKPPKETTTGSLSPKIESDFDSSEDSDLKDEDNTQSTSQAHSVRQSARTAGKALKYTEISSGDDSSDNDDEIDVPEDMDEKVKSPAVKNESQSEDIKPADSSAQPISAKKEPLVQATLSSMFKKAEEKKDLLLRSSEQVQRKNIQQGRRVVEDEIEVLSSSSQDYNVDDDSDEDWAEVDTDPCIRGARGGVGARGGHGASGGWRGGQDGAAAPIGARNNNPNPMRLALPAD